MSGEVKGLFTKKQNKTRRNKQIYYRLFKMVSVGVIDDPINQAYDIISTTALLVNLAATFMNTFNSVNAAYGTLLSTIESVTVAFFAIDYVLRIITSNQLYPDLNAPRSILKYVTSFAGIIDLLSFIPYYMPFFFPAVSSMDPSSACAASSASSGS